MKLIFNEVSTVKLVGFQPFQCIIIASGKKWTFSKFVSDEYIEDGFCFVNNRYVLRNYLSEKSFLANRILSFRQASMSISSDYELETYRQPFEFLAKTGELLQFSLQQEDVGYVGRVKKVNDKSCVIQLFSTKGVWLKEFNFKYDAIRTFQIKGNYLDSLAILANQASA